MGKLSKKKNSHQLQSAVPGPGRGELETGSFPSFQVFLWMWLAQENEEMMDDEDMAP